MFAALDISSSALVAQRMRLVTVAGNLANLSSLRDENGQVRPYQARYVVFQTDPSVGGSTGASGVKVAAIQTENMEPEYRYDPGHPLAIRSGPWKGYVAYPRVDMMAEMVDALEATRSYEANVGVMELTRNMAMQTLRILG
ncbi:MAG: flagellar basal-body rod protein FlgC [Pirellulaceae bacterium]|nr:MAG: flagellar basal-body rod protein FlgC [Pirellulaceae bacterium]GIW95072.1 MAG: flagellar basal-body rod protein FlgC [Pirellulaceae bacterium]